MELIDYISLDGAELNTLPLYYKKIYYNPLVPNDDENKLYYSSELLQGTIVKRPEPRRDISKLLDFSPYYFK